MYLEVEVEDDTFCFTLRVVLEAHANVVTAATPKDDASLPRFRPATDPFAETRRRARSSLDLEDFF